MHTHRLGSFCSGLPMAGRGLAWELVAKQVDLAHSWARRIDSYCLVQRRLGLHIEDGHRLLYICIYTQVFVYDSCVDYVRVRRK